MPQLRTISRCSATFVGLVGRWWRATRSSARITTGSGGGGTLAPPEPNMGPDSHHELAPDRLARELAPDRLAMSSRLIASPQSSRLIASPQSSRLIASPRSSRLIDSPRARAWSEIAFCQPRSQQPRTTLPGRFFKWRLRRQPNRPAMSYIALAAARSEAPITPPSLHAI